MISDAKKISLEISDRTIYFLPQDFFLLATRISFLIQEKNSCDKKKQIFRQEKRSFSHYIEKHFLGIRKHTCEGVCSCGERLVSIIRCVSKLSNQCSWRKSLGTKLSISKRSSKTEVNTFTWWTHSCVEGHSRTWDCVAANICVRLCRTHNPQRTGAALKSFADQSFI